MTAVESFGPVPPLGRAQFSHRRPLNLDRFWYGACYYPEHWDEPTRRSDAVRMAAAHFNVVRMGEFAWDLIEPQPDTFKFDLFDRTIEELARHGIRTILCTPTATPPRWLTRDFPEILRCDARGDPLSHGSRQHCDLNHPVFREHSRRITRVLASHFHRNPNVIGWQTDNEIYCHFSDDHSPAAENAFRSFLRAKFDGDIESLNRAWGTAFWAQTYRSFDEIPTPRDQRPTYLNPSHRLDYCRFLSEAAARFQHDQVVILRQANPAWFVFHNGVFRKPDYRGLFGQDLDFMGYDVYPNFEPNPERRSRSHAFNADRVRAMVGHVIIPEHQAGAGGQNDYSLVSPERGEMRMLCYRSIARGGDSLLFFNWRTCRFGAEQYWRGIIDHDNIPRSRYDEAAQLGAELHRLSSYLRGTHVVMDCAVACGDYDVNWSHECSSLGLPKPDAVAEQLHAWLYDRGLRVGCIHPADSLDGLRLIVIPHWSLFRDEWLLSLEQWTRAGGVLIVGARTATRTIANQVIADTPPGFFAPICGVRVVDFGRICSEANRPLAIQMDRSEIRPAHWWEQLEVENDVEVIGRWANRQLVGTPAVTCKAIGHGRVVYVATYLVDEVLDQLLPSAVAWTGLESARPADLRGVDIVERAGSDHRLSFLINSNDFAVTLPDVPTATELLSGSLHPDGPCRIEPFGVRVMWRTRS